MGADACSCCDHGQRGRDEFQGRSVGLDAGNDEDHIPSVLITQKQMENSENLYDKDVVACLTR